MPRPTLVYFVADADRNLWIQMTKDLEVAVMLDEERLARSLAVVRIEEYSTVLEAQDRLKKLTRTSIDRRKRLVSISNPNWKRVSDDTHVPVTPTGAETLPGVSGYAKRGLILGEISAYGFEDHGRDDSSGGVPAPVPITVGPRAGSDAKAFPPSGL
jgi:hypothetical protein